MSMSEKQRSDLSSAIFRLFMAAEEGAIDVDQTTFTLKELASGSSAPRARRKAPRGDFSKLHASPFDKALIEPQNLEVMAKKLLNMSQMYGWGFTENDVPSVPEFKPRTIHEVLMPMLHLPSKGMKGSFIRTFEELWRCVELPKNCHLSSLRISTDPSRLRQPDDYGCFPGISWVAFDPVGLVNESVVSARKKAPRHQLQLAGLECLLAVDLFPDWAKFLNQQREYSVVMGGIQAKSINPYWDSALSLEFDHRDGETLVIHYYPDNIANPSWYFPTVRYL